MKHVARASMLLALSLATTACVALPGAQHRDIAQRPAAASAERNDIRLGYRETRLTVPVSLGGTSSYNFIIDTGAERTSVSRELADRLGLRAGAPITLTSMTSTNLVDTVVVPSLGIPSLGTHQSIVAPALDRYNVGAEGLLGIDTLQGKRVVIDFDQNLMAVSDAEPRRRPRRHNEVVVGAQSHAGQLIVADAFVGSNRVRVLIDTGSMITFGNSALRRKVRMRTRPSQVTFGGVTGELAKGDYTVVQDMRVGGATFDFLPIAFADVEPFRHYGLQDRPALILGMDALSRFRSVEIDFANRQIRLRMHRRDSFATLSPLEPHLPRTSLYGVTFTNN